jgi:hypothetical protein
MNTRRRRRNYIDYRWKEEATMKVRPLVLLMKLGSMQGREFVSERG